MMVHDVDAVIVSELGGKSEVGQNIGSDFVYAWSIFDYADCAVVVGFGDDTEAVAFEKDVIVVKEQKMRLEKT